MDPILRYAVVLFFLGLLALGKKYYKNLTQIRSKPRSFLVIYIQSFWNIL